MPVIVIPVIVPGIVIGPVLANPRVRRRDIPDGRLAIRHDTLADPRRFQVDDPYVIAFAHVATRPSRRGSRNVTGFDPERHRFHDFAETDRVAHSTAAACPRSAANRPRRRRQVREWQHGPDRAAYDRRRPPVRRRCDWPASDPRRRVDRHRPWAFGRRLRFVDHPTRFPGVRSTAPICRSPTRFPACDQQHRPDDRRLSGLGRPLRFVGLPTRFPGVRSTLPICRSPNRVLDEVDRGKETDPGVRLERIPDEVADRDMEDRDTLEGEVVGRLTEGRLIEGLLIEGLALRTGWLGPAERRATTDRRTSAVGRTPAHRGRSIERG